MDILTSLNDKQISAVTATEGPLLIVAGAGSGKTRVLCHRIAYLIEKGVGPENILAVTFTNKAAGEMKERVAKLLKKPGNISIGTFHSICLRILRRESESINYPTNFIIYDEQDQETLVKQVTKELNIDSTRFKPHPILTAISSAKNEMLDEETYQNQAQTLFQKTAGKIYASYQKALQRNNALDFDDLLLKTLAIFQKNPAILDKYQEQFRYILIDEYQDTNRVQYLLIKLLAGKYRNLCLIGDPDQSIYGWRGADFRNILNFEKDYPEAKTVLLEQNYRSTQVILEAAHHIISKNQFRKEKKLWTTNQGGRLININLLGNEREEADFIAKEIKSLAKQEKRRLSDFTVLYRTNAQSRAIEEAFLKYVLDYKIVGGVKFYGRKEIKDILAYLRIIYNPRDKVSLSRIINLPARGLSTVPKELLDVCLELNPDQLDALNIPTRKISALKKFIEIISACRELSNELPLSELIRFTLKKSGYQEYIQNEGEDSKKDQLQGRWENILEFIGVAKKYDQMSNGEGLANFLNEVSLIQSADENKEKDDLVNLMTLHSAKGLEFPIVFIAGMEEGIFPHSRTLYNPQEMEEERRLCYVGLTRAKERLYLLFTGQRRLYGGVQYNSPSRFLSDLPEHLIETNDLSSDKEDNFIVYN